MTHPDTQAPVEVARPGKRDRLIAAAQAAMLAHGVERTSLADIAHAADVPLGNVYYYFKTKGELVAAVIERQRSRQQEAFAALDQRPTPAQRLCALLDSWMAQREKLTAHGCPVGTLGTELRKGADELADDSAAVLAGLLGWFERQFTEMGRGDARQLAVALLAAYEGTILLANTLADQDLITVEGERLKQWITSLA
ncbi:TetR/AcrR family transcriptional regulator [Kutzneria sp. NPDC051319]|uniref:TetR/AcrR family transcriptional regulator n=1 Tax=Kutzneria sp. NPDC051319 TaxID=3155047 RepID=UPI003416BC7E